MTQNTSFLNALLTRRSILAKKLGTPGPDTKELQDILTAALRVPDHGKIGPWRILVCDEKAQKNLGERIGDVYAANTPEAEDKHIAFEKARTNRAPLLLIVISSPDLDHKVPEWEQILSSGAVCMNVLHAAHALGYAGQWLTEWVAYDYQINAYLGLSSHEKIAGYIYIGTACETPDERTRPDINERVTYL